MRHLLSALSVLSAFSLSACFVPLPDESTHRGNRGYDFECCLDGQLSTCHCPSGICDAFFLRCGGASCANPGQSCPDAGTPPDAGKGYDFECCIGQKLQTCHCPSGICDAFFLRCGGASCANPGESCPDGG